MSIILIKTLRIVLNSLNSLIILVSESLLNSFKLTICLLHKPTFPSPNDRGSSIYSHYFV